MAFKRFGPNDIVLNTMRAHPNSDFFVYGGRIFYNSRPKVSGSFAVSVTNVPEGFISLYEYNINRSSDIAGGGARTLAGAGSSSYIYPFIYKDSARASFRTAIGTTTGDEWTDAEVGDVLYGTYPQSASITRDYQSAITPGTPGVAALPPNFFALKNRLEYYGMRSRTYKDFSEKTSGELNTISIPSIFYGTRMRPGTVSLKWYFTGSLAGELQDVKHNGQLMQVSGAGNTNRVNQVAGVVLYDEGVILLTGSWGLNGESIGLKSDGTSATPSWLYYGAGTRDGVNTSTAAATFVSAAFGLNFKGTTETQVMTMFAHARRGEVNYSNNPTFLEYGQRQVRLTSSHVFEENPERLIKNIVSSSYSDYSSSFERQVYISRIGIYDNSKNLIGVATLSSPINKAEDRDITFKLKLDI
jgi:hypothetical protein